MSWKKKIKNAFIFFMAFFIAFLVIAEFAFRFSDKAVYKIQTNKIWGHRGSGPGEEENTIKSFEGAFAAGAGGVELDVFFSLEHNRFIVTHDKPQPGHEGELLFLETVFPEFAGAGYFWIDFKNLPNLSNESSVKALTVLQKLLFKHQLKEKVVIESPAPTLNLRLFKKAGLATSFTFFPARNKGVLYYYYQIVRARACFLLGCYDYLSVSNDYYNEDLKRLFGGFSFFIYVVNNQDRMKKLLGDNSVAAILTDHLDLMR